ncbi:MAG TPA: PIN domain-containing protein [Chloroflexota bacterium]
MILTDAGPLVAIIDRDDPDHDACVSALSSLRGPMVTTWPAFTEAMYLLGRGGWPPQSHLWRLLLSGRLEAADPEESPASRLAELMERYSDHPMDLADASLVALAESRNVQQIFTLDRSDFGSYRIRGRKPFHVIP